MPYSQGSFTNIAVDAPIDVQTPNIHKGTFKSATATKVVMNWKGGLREFEYWEIQQVNVGDDFKDVLREDGIVWIRPIK
ncbi:hypothetical protein B7L09_03725 [Pseudomonas mandelii]|nr:hypothetical protein B7L09_03725 [Pseudomonas mandelii]